MDAWEGKPLKQARIVLVLGCLAGVATYLVTSLERPDQLLLASDVYRHATASLLAGEELYGVHPPDRSGYSFLYPPIATLLFLPHALLWSDLAAFVLQTGLNLLAAIGTAVVIYRALQRRGRPVERVDLALLATFMVISVYSAIQFMNGQVNHWLAFALALGFDAMDRDRRRVAGVAFAAVALVKVFPAIMGMWLLRLRAWRALSAAIVTGILGLLVGAIVFGPELTLIYLNDVLLGRFGAETYDGRPSPYSNVDGVHRQLAAIWPAGGRLHTVIGFAVVGGLVVAALRRVDTPLHRDVAALATLAGILLFLPLQPLYFPLITFPLVMLLYARFEPVARRIFLAGTVLTFAHLNQEAIDLGLDLAPLPAGTANTLGDGAAAVFTVILPPTLGLWVLLFACVLIQSPPTETRSAGPTVAPADD